jgi:hypothetical protein
MLIAMAIRIWYSWEGAILRLILRIMKLSSIRKAGWCISLLEDIITLSTKVHFLRSFCTLEPKHFRN